MKAAERETTESLLALTSSSSIQRSFREISGQIAGKSIVLGNEKAQTATTKYANRAKGETKRQRGQVVSNRACKRSRIADPSTAPVSAEVVKALHVAWCTYTAALMAQCSGVNQLQTRLASAELIGASVMVLECAKDPSLEGLTGIVSGSSKNCLYLASDLSNVGKDVDQGQGTAESEPRYRVIRVIRACAVLAVELPPKGGSSSLSTGARASRSSRAAQVCILHGEDTTFTPPNP